jgi:Protein of unknown function (DUF1570)
MPAMNCRRLILWSFVPLMLAVGGALALAGDAPAKAERAAKSKPSTESAPDAVQTVDQVTFRHHEKTRSVAGHVLVEAGDGGLLLQSADGALWVLPAEEVVSRQPTDTPFKPLTKDELAKQLLAELPPGFRIHTTPHYVVCYNTSRTYAQWTSSLLERLYRAFTNYWRHEGLDIREPEFPLAVMVYADHETYEQAGQEDLGGPAGGIVGYYSLRSNRVNMYDLTGVESLRGPRDRRGSLKEINEMLSQPAAVPLVATIVHEATHQIAFNCGLQTRFADIPLWQCEGLAVYFEAPDLSSTRGWNGIGRVNYPRLDVFLDNLPNWRAGALETLVVDDKRFRPAEAASRQQQVAESQKVVGAYADAWALTYYLIRFRNDQYKAYLKMLATKQPLMADTPEVRRTEFQQCFGDLEELENDFLKQMSRVH